MEGSEGDEEGMIPRSVELIFSEIEKAQSSEWKFSVRVEIKQIYLD